MENSNVITGFCRRRHDQIELEKGIALCKERFQNIMAVLEKDPLDHKTLGIYISQYKIVREDCPLFYGVDMPSEYDCQINRKLREKGIIIKI